MSEFKGLNVHDIVNQYIDKQVSQAILPIGRQAELLGISRASVYYQPVPIDDETLQVLHLLDEVYTELPFYGSRRLARELSNRLGRSINRKRVQGLMRTLGIEAIYPKPNLSQNDTADIRYPYLLKGITANHPNHIWGVDITYIRLLKGFVYLVAYLDWYSRYIVGWALSTSLEAAFCLEAAAQAVKLGLPEIMNSDQGVQFTSLEYRDFWEALQVAISMDGKGRALDNIFTERLWRTIKWEEVYLKAYESVTEAYDNLKAYISFYNNRRLHQALNYRTPADIYFSTNIT